MLRSGLGKAKKAKEHAEEGLEKVRAKPWAEPLGKALRISGKIAGAVEGLVPGANIIGGALSFGATLLNPEATLEDLQRELKEARISSTKSSNEISKMKDMMSQTFHLVADNRFKVRKTFSQTRKVFTPCCTFRMALRLLMQPTKFSSERVLTASMASPLSSRRLLPRASALTG